MYIDECFRLLGIGKTTDQSRIKKAYAQAARQYHPETHPDEWSRLHEAYQGALKYAKGQIVTGGSAGGYSGSTPQDYTSESEEDNGFNQLFETLDQDIENEYAECKERLLQFLKRKRHSIFANAGFWNQLFSMGEYTRCREDDECVRAILKLAVKKHFFMKTFEIVYWNLQELRNYLHAVSKRELAGEVEKAIERLEYKWGLTSLNWESIEKKKWKYISWMTFESIFQIPIYIRLIIFELLLYMLTDISVSDLFSAGTFIFLIFEYFFWAIKKSAWESDKNPKLKADRERKKKEKKETSKVVKAVRIIAVILVLTTAIGGCCASLLAESNKAENTITIVLDASRAEWEVLLYAQFSEDILSKDPLKKDRSYVFYLFDEGKTSERVYLISSNEQVRFEELINSGNKIYIRGAYETIQPDEVIADAWKYYVGSGRDLLEVLKDNSMVEAAEPWLEKVFRVEAFGEYKQ